ncbi:MAG: phenylalanine--tRNA ligase subunit beta, partial [Patescibacteria group bacterium]
MNFDFPMLVSWQLLQKFVQPIKPLSDKELMETLTMSVVEVEGVVNQSQRLQNVVVGQVTEVYDHPQADKLKMAKVDIGKESVTIVCGGVNLREGMKVALAKPGAMVKWHGQGDFIKLEEVVIRGQVSQGMACAAEELALPDDQAVEHGIMDLTNLEAKPGTPLAEALAYDDVILDIENKSLTHRPDLWGHIGLARELSAIWQVPLNLPEPPAIEMSAKEVSLKVSLKDKTKAKRYLGVVMSGLKVGPSPKWLKQALVCLGVRPINNIVDITNYVLLEMGQPLHAFDLNKLAGPEIIVRTAKSGESIVTLDGVERKLTEDMLVIADKKKSLAIAGVMGGSNSEVDGKTTSIVLESANFDAINIRQTSAKLGLRTEASVRFEKALDPELAEMALRRVVKLIMEIVPGVKVVSKVADEYPKPLKIQSINLPLEWLWRRLGADIGKSEVIGILSRLEFKVQDNGDNLIVTPPSFRATRDITIPEDLVEEVARIYGYGRLPKILPKFPINPPLKDPKQELRWKIRDLLTSLGWNETMSYSFTDGSALSQFKEGKVEIELFNPVDSKMIFLRQLLMETTLPQFAYNCKRSSSEDIKMYEMGRVFNKKEQTDDLEKIQGYNLALSIRLVKKEKGDNKNIYIDSFEELKGVVEKILNFVGL